MLGRQKAVKARLALGAILLAGSASAQEDAAAEALFDKGLSEMEAGHYETACPTLKESQRLDPRMGTLFTLAECEAKGGMIASAVAHYDEYLRLFGRLTPAQKAAQAGREKVSAAQKAALAPQVPYVTLVLRDAPPGTSVKWDDMVFNLPALGVPLPVNPGEHVVTTQVPGRANVVTRVAVAKGERKQIELAVGARAKERGAERPAAPVVAVATPDAPPAPSPADAEAADRARKIWIYGVGSVGVMGVVVGSVAGAMVLGKKGTIDDNCLGSSCNASGKEAADEAQRLGLVSTVGFGVGIAGLATAAILLLTEPPAATAAATRSWTPLVADRKGGVVIGVERRW